MFFINFKKTTSSFKKFNAPDLKQLVWCLNVLAKQRITQKVAITYTRLNFQICQFLVRRGILSLVSMTRAKKTDYLAGAILVRVRLVDNKKPFTKVILQEFQYTHKSRNYLSSFSKTLSWWKLKPYRFAKLVVVKTVFGLMTAHECVYYRIGGKVLLILI